MPRRAPARGSCDALQPGGGRTVTSYMTVRAVLIWGVVLFASTLLAVYLVDDVVASAARSVSPGVRGLAAATTRAAEIASGFAVSKFLAGTLVAAAGITLMLAPRYRRTGRLVVFIGVAQLAARLIAGVLKNVFQHPRPFEALDTARSYELFFTHGGSFPSGHAAHFWPFFFAVAVAFPRWRWPFLILSVLVSIARITVNDHYVSDVAASAAISAFVVYACARAFTVNPAITRPAALSVVSRK
jgi:membrane-associated phospholipid phosphatase